MSRNSQRSCGPCVLSARQLQVIELVAPGLKNTEVAEAIGTTEFVIKV
jgi:DNA-binding NarL/FixJ family response regulator